MFGVRVGIPLWNHLHTVLQCQQTSSQHITKVSSAYNSAGIKLRDTNVHVLVMCWDEGNFFIAVVVECIILTICYANVLLSIYSTCIIICIKFLIILTWPLLL